MYKGWLIRKKNKIHYKTYYENTTVWCHVKTVKQIYGI